MIQVTYNPSKEKLISFKQFSDVNWGEHSDDGDPQIDFFDYPKILFENTIDNQVVSQLCVFLKTMLFSDRVIHFAGIGGVVTHKDFRHRGYALETINFTLGELKKLGIEVSMLCTDIEKLGGLYSKAGFTPIGKDYYFIDKNGALKSESGGMVVAIDAIKDYILTTASPLFVGLSNF